MNLAEAVVLGIIQGVFEWLPVSSEAVISIVLTQFMGSQPVSSVNIAIFMHLGTMFSALIYFRRDYIAMLKNLYSYLKKLGKRGGGLPEDYRLEDFIFFATFLTGLVGGILYLFLLELVPKNPDVFTALVGVFLFFTGIMQMKNSSDREVEDIRRTDSYLVGILQGLAVIPGVSRSGSTVFGLLVRDFDSKAAFKLSFLMSVPAVFASQIGLNLFSEFIITKKLLLGALVSFLVGLFSINLVLKISEKLEVSYICFGLAILSFVFVMF